MYLINGEHRTTDEHSHMRSDRSFGPVNLSSWKTDVGTLHSVIIDEQGTVEEWLLPGTDGNTVTTQLAIGEELWTINGPKKLSSIDSFSLPEDTQLYNLVLDGSHTYFVEGYCVTGFINGLDFDYKNWSVKGEGWLSDNYRK